MEHSVEEVELKGGIKGLLVKTPGARVVNFLVEFRAGFDLADESKYELPHVMEHAMFTSKTFPRPRQFSKEVEKNGAYNNAYTYEYSLEYDYACAEFEAIRIADLIAVQLTEPIFPAAELKTEIANIREELSNMIGDHQSFCRENLYSEATGRPSLEQRIIQLPTIGTPDLEDFYKRTHSSGNMRFVIAGDTDFKPILQRLSLGLPVGERLNIPHKKTHHLSEPITVKRAADQIYYSAYSVLEKRLSYRKLTAARIIRNLLTNGFSSTLFGLVRERGLAYSLGMGVDRGLYDSGWRLGGAVTETNCRKLFKLIAAEMKKARDGRFSQKQFESTKKLMLGQRAISYQRIDQLVRYYADYFETDRFEQFDTVDNYIIDISKTEATAAFNELFKESRWGVGLVGPIGPPLAQELQGSLAEIWK